MNIDKLKLETNRNKAIMNFAHMLAQQVNDAGLFRSCINCEMWIDKTEQCDKFNMRPPAHVIVTGCKEHSDNIPF